jgi:putative NIF3 family GTP cyclohydrolase 1 type 2
VVFFTNDLTLSVLEEAVQKKANLIITYHPTPFVALKRFSNDNVASRVILTAAASGMAIYSPHTAWDVARPGLNDWLLEGIINASYSCASQPMTISTAAIRPLIPSENPLYAGIGAGEGRCAQLPNLLSLTNLIEGVKKHLNIPHVQVAVPKRLLDESSSSSAATTTHSTTTPQIPNALIHTVSTCAGSGASFIDNVVSCTKQNIETATPEIKNQSAVSYGAYVTGEMSHHEVLAAINAGLIIILTHHSKCERGYIPVFAERFRKEITTNVSSPSFEIIISQKDADPLFIV